MTLEQTRDDLAALLKKNDLKIVLAESCTGGLCAATMTQVPGISNHLCGSFVTYRASAKRDWLGVSQYIIDTYTTESEYCANEMADKALEETVEAKWSAAVVGHLNENGRIWVSVVHRIKPSGFGKAGEYQNYRVTRDLPEGTREERQREAARLTLKFLLECMIPVYSDRE